MVYSILIFYLLGKHTSAYSIKDRTCNIKPELIKLLGFYYFEFVTIANTGTTDVLFTSTKLIAVFITNTY